MTGTDEPEAAAKKDESSPGMTIGRASAEPNLRQGDESPRSRVSAYTDENDYKLVEWQKQVLADDSLARTAKYILLVWGIFSELDDELIAKEGAWARVVEPVPGAFVDLTRLAESTYYRHVQAVETSSWVEPVGEFRYDAGNRTLTQTRYRLVLREEGV